MAMHWEHRINNMVKWHNDIFLVQMPNVHVCRRTYCSNMAKSGMNPKTLQYLMGHSDIGVTLNTYTHLGLEDAADELKRIEELAFADRNWKKSRKRIRYHKKCSGQFNIERTFGALLRQGVFLLLKSKLHGRMNNMV